MTDTPAKLIARIERDLALLKATVTGQTYQAPITGWREVRGSHAISYVADPDGRDTPPATYGRSPALGG